MQAATASPAAKPSLAARLDWIVPAGVVMLVFVMLVPVPAIVLDILLATSITTGILVLLSALYILKPVQFSVFPTLLLFLTLFRISLNIASSRRILLHGNEGAAAAGHVIGAFGQFVVGGNYVVGFVIFLALIAIQYLVINHGAVRTAEVSARFTLDALPGKQMAIDADLNAGLINEAQARERRTEIARDAEFHGAMDGAARFSQRDALATILITAINIVAGFLIGVFQLHIPFDEALKTYTILTVGDGLVTMVPSLLVSVAGGLVVTRASSDATVGTEMGRQLLTKKRPLQIAAGAMFALGLIPGLPKLSFFLLGGICAYLASRTKEGKSGPATGGAGAPGEKKPSSQEQLESLIKLDELSLEVGYGLVPLVDQNRGGQLLQRIRALRQHLAIEIGFLVPSIHITDQAKLKQREYVIRLRGAEVARWELQQDCLLAISSEPNAATMPGLDTKEPAFGAAAKWISPQMQEQALANGYAVVDHTSIMATHLAEVVRSHAYELLTRHETKRLLDAMSEAQPKLVEELVPKLLSLGEVQKVLQQLLREQVSVRDLPAILETLIDTAPLTKNPVQLVETVRQILGRSLVQPLLGTDGKLHLLALDPSIEDEITQAFDPQAAGRGQARQPAFLRKLLDNLKRIVGDKTAMDSTVLLCASPARYHLRRLLEPFLPRVIVLSPGEIPNTVTVQSLGTLG
ncbi:MAG TPA: flagellar biosynthesis protein FlhA [Candidatus Acidoferrales bacterium]|jgi:flagellar biosynthesis protein FlhA|nr:flagellar biosynthesis protein FlhA [Candidatus Acidoferrales bacterium]